MRALVAAALLASACASPVAAQSYERVCGYVGSIYACHSKRESARSETLSSCWSDTGTGQHRCTSQTYQKVPPTPPPYLVKKYQAEKTVAGTNH
jgi:hypothetical protein